MPLDESDLFAILIYPKEAATWKSHVIDFGIAGKYEHDPMVNTESLKDLGKQYLTMTFRLDYFDQLRKSPKGPFSALIKRMDEEIVALKNHPVHLNVKWMRAVILFVAARKEHAMQEYADLIDQ